MQTSALFNTRTFHHPQEKPRCGDLDFPGGRVARSLPACTGCGFDPWSGKMSHAVERPSLNTTMTVPMCSCSLCSVTRDVTAKSSVHSLHLEQASALQQRPSTNGKISSLIKSKKPHTHHSHSLPRQPLIHFFLKIIFYVDYFIFRICHNIVPVSHFGFLAMRHVGSRVPSRGWTLTPCTGRQSPNHRTTREVP